MSLDAHETARTRTFGLKDEAHHHDVKELSLQLVVGVAERVLLHGVKLLRRDALTLGLLP